MEIEPFVGNGEIESSCPGLRADIRHAAVSISRVDEDLVRVTLEKGRVQRQQVGGGLLVGHSHSVRLHVKGVDHSGIGEVSIHSGLSAAGVVVQRLHVQLVIFMVIKQFYSRIILTSPYPALIVKDCLVSTVTTD